MTWLIKVRPSTIGHNTYTSMTAGCPIGGRTRHETNISDRVPFV